MYKRQPLNLNVHFHMLLLDGVFVSDASEPRGVRWVRVPAPSTEEVQALVVELARDLESWLSREGYGTDEASEEDEDANSDALLFAASIAGRVAMGTSGLRRRRPLRLARRVLSARGCGAWSRPKPERAGAPVRAEPGGPA